MKRCMLKCWPRKVNFLFICVCFLIYFRQGWLAVMIGWFRYRLFGFFARYELQKGGINALSPWGTGIVSNAGSGFGVTPGLACPHRLYCLSSAKINSVRTPAWVYGPPLAAGHQEAALGHCRITSFIHRANITHQL